MIGFRIGDRVVVEYSTSYSNIEKGSTGVVVELIDDIDYVGVRFDEPISGGHSCGGRCDCGHGWRLIWTDLSLIEEDDEFDADGDVFDKYVGNFI